MNFKCNSSKGLILILNAVQDAVRKQYYVSRSQPLFYSHSLLGANLWAGYQLPTALSMVTEVFVDSIHQYLANLWYLQICILGWFVSCHFQAYSGAHLLGEYFIHAQSVSTCNFLPNFKFKSGTL